MRAIELSAGDLRLVVLPEVGGGIARFDLARPYGITPLFRPWDGASADPNRLGCYVLCPFSNRISGGGLEAGDRFWPLAPNLAGEPYPIHGDAWQQPWTVEETTGTALDLVLESGSLPPFAYRAQLRYELADHALRARLRVQHRGEVAVPYGLGFHPWLPRTPETTLQAAAQAVWLERPDHLPDRRLPVTLRPQWDFREPRPLPAHLDQQRLRRLAGAGADPLAGAWPRARDRGERRAHNLRPVLAGRERRFLLLRAGLARGRRLPSAGRAKGARPEAPATRRRVRGRVSLLRDRGGLTQRRKTDDLQPHAPTRFHGVRPNGIVIRPIALALAASRGAVLRRGSHQVDLRRPGGVARSRGAATGVTEVRPLRRQLFLGLVRGTVAIRAAGWFGVHGLPGSHGPGNRDRVGGPWLTKG